MGMTAGEAAAPEANPEDIELDEGDDEEGGEAGAAGEIELEQQAVPEGVFGSVGAQADKIGALDRFKKRKTDGD